MADSTRGFGIDIGGSGIKGAPVDLDEGQFAGERLRIPTPQPSTPEAVAEVVAQIVDRAAAGTGRSASPSPPSSMHGVARTAANVDKSWIGTDVEAVVGERLGANGRSRQRRRRRRASPRCASARRKDKRRRRARRHARHRHRHRADPRRPPRAQHRARAPRDRRPRRRDAAPSDARPDREDLDWEQWAERLQRYFAVSRPVLAGPDRRRRRGEQEGAKFLPLLNLRTPIVPAAPAQRRRHHRRRAARGRSQVSPALK